MPPQPVDGRPNSIMRGIPDAQNFTPSPGSTERYATLFDHHFYVVCAKHPEEPNVRH